MFTGQLQKGKPARGTAGQAAVEFALIAGILVLLVFGIVEVGRLMFINSEIENAASEAAHVAALNPNASPTDLVNAAKSKLVIADRNLLTTSNVVVTRPCCPYCPVQVTIRYHWTSFVQFLGSGDLTKISHKLIEYVPPTPCP